MRYIDRKEVNGKTMIIVDTEGMAIEDIVENMQINGWSFPRITVAYDTNTGGRKKQDVPATRVREIRDRYHFDSWMFEAVRNKMGANQSITVQINNTKNKVAIIKSTGRAYNDFLNEIGPAAVQDDFNDLLFQDSQQYSKSQDQFTDYNQYDDNGSAEAVVSSLYNDNYQDASNLTDMQRQTRRAAGRYEEQKQVEELPKKSHIFMILLSILMLIPPATLFGLFSLIDVIKGKKCRTTEPEEYKRRIKEARGFLIAAVLVDIIVFAVLVFLNKSFFLGLIGLG